MELLSLAMEIGKLDVNFFDLGGMLFLMSGPKRHLVFQGSQGLGNGFNSRLFLGLLTVDSGNLSTEKSEFGILQRGF